jgi:hypothetical protein
MVTARTAKILRIKMKPTSLLLVLAGGLWLAQTMMAGERTDKFQPFLYAAEGAQKIIRYGSDGNVAWEYPAEMARDVWALPNHNVLFCFNRQYDSGKHDNPSGVMEVTPGKRVVFSFSTTGQVWSCQRLVDGNTLVGAASQGKLLVVNPEAMVIKTIHLLNPPGTLVREIKLSFAPFSVIRLENGNTVISGQQSMVEVDPADKIIWSVDGKDLPDLGIRWFAGIQVLPNGNIFVCNAGGKVPFLEIGRDKRVIWQSPNGMNIPFGHGVQRLDIEGKTQK